MNSSAVLLAAGRSRRFGSDKRWHTLNDGAPMWLHCARALVAHVKEVLIVVRCDEIKHFESELEASMRVVGSTGAENGMGATLASSMEALGQAEAVLIALADMPFIEAKTYSRITQALGEHNIVVPRYDGQTGHPVGFGGQFFPLLATLDGDRGARGLIRARPEACIYLDTSDAGILRDVDRLEDLR